MGFIGDSVNSSATVAERTGAAISGGAGLAVKYNIAGAIVPCSVVGEAAIGVLIAQTGDCAKGDAVTVQIKDVALWRSGAALTRGSMLTTDAGGCAVTAAAGDFILGVAMGACGAAGQLVPVQIAKCGFMPE